MLLPPIPEGAAWGIYLAPLISFLVIVIALWHRPLWAGRCTIAAIGLGAAYHITGNPRARSHATASSASSSNHLRALPRRKL